MIGNDVIDLVVAKKESNWQRSGFLNKIFTPHEQVLILNSKTPEEMVWNLWSRKEAAYKIFNRQTQIRAFIPLQLECFDLKTENKMSYGKVVCYDQTYYTQTKLTSKCIETIAVLNVADFDKIVVLNTTENLVKSNGIPYYCSNGILYPISKSHHGKYQQMIRLSN